MKTDSKISVLFFGTPEFAARCLDRLLHSAKYRVIGVVTNPDRPAGRGKSLTASPVKQLAVSHDIPVFQSSSLRKELQRFHEWLAPLLPIDIGVVVAFGQILPKEVLAAPSAGCINVHASLLPRWRGAAPINRAIMEGDTETGVALMQMEEGLDTGAVFSEERISIEDNNIASEIHDILAQKGAELLVKDLARIANKECTAQAQIHSAEDESRITYARKITNDELKIDWSQNARTILRFIHGTSHIPGAFTFIKGVRFKIFRVALGQEDYALSLQQKESAAPGTVVFAHGSVLAIKTGDGKTVNILEAQLEGKKRLPVTELLLGGIFHPGDILQ